MRIQGWLITPVETKCLIFTRPMVILDQFRDVLHKPMLRRVDPQTPSLGLRLGR
jgi:hypothetical protein